MINLTLLLWATTVTNTPHETLIFGLIEENEGRATDGSDQNIQSIGLGSHLWQIDEDGPELKRGWMFRLRLTMQHVKDKYERRGRDNFVAVIADATDVFMTESLDELTLEHLKERFLTEFSDQKIVFSTQIYCCNPWELREFGRRDWDTYYEKKGEIPSMYKHLNAGTFMGYASAINEMADEMKLWNTTYHRHEGFHSLAGLESSKDLHMIDLEVDDDEWQLAAWFFQDQDKETPLSGLDYHQDLFAVTGTFRAQETEDDGYAVFPRDHFYRMFGEFPETFDNDNDMDQLIVCPYKYDAVKDNDMDQLIVCPYEYDTVKMEYTNTITGGHPLVFHFAGNDWLCACTIFAADDFENLRPKFRKNCEERYSMWFERVEEGILDAAASDEASDVLYLPPLPEVQEDYAVQVSRRLGSSFRELDGSPYKKKRVPRELVGNPYNRELDSSPYKKKRVPRELIGRELDGNPYGHELDGSPYKKKLIPRERDGNPYNRELDSSPYKKKHVPRKLMSRELDGNPYNRELDSSPCKKHVPRILMFRELDGAYNRELDSSPYKKKRIPRALISRELDGNPYNRERELDSSPYKKKCIPRVLISRELDGNPYKKKKRFPRELDSSPYKKKRVSRDLDSNPYN